MDIIETLRYLNSEDGPNIPLRTLGVYCGISHGTICQYLNHKMSPKPETRAQIERGVRDLVNEIWDETKWIFDRKNRARSHANEDARSASE